MKINQLTDEELIRRVQNRDQEAFAELINRFTPRIWGVVVTNARHRLDAEEIRTDIWMAVWNNINHLRNVESFGAWLHRIAYNACQRYYTIARQSRNEIPHEFDEIVEQIDEHAAARYREFQLIADIREAVHHLPQKLRSVAKLFYLESWKIKEIASELSMPIGTVKTKLREIREILRSEFDPAPIKGAIMAKETKQSEVALRTLNNESKNNRQPALLNVNADDPTGDSWGLPDGIVARFGKGNISDVKLSPDGTYFAVATGVGLWWYDVTTMQPISLWKVAGGDVNTIDFSPDGRLIIMNTVGSIIRIMDVETGECIREIKDQDGFGGLACSSNGKWAAISGGSGFVNVLDIETGLQIAQMDRGEHKWKSNDIYDLQFTPDGTLLAAIAGNPFHSSGKKETYDEILNPDSEGSQIYVWDPTTGKKLVKFAGHRFALSSDSRLVAGSSPDETSTNEKCVDSNISVWDISTGEQIAYFTEHTEWIDSLTFSPCGKYIASSDETLRIWDIETSSELKVYPNFTDPFYSNTGHLYAIKYDGATSSLDVWDVEARESILQIQAGIGSFAFAYSLAMAYTHQLVDRPTDKTKNANIPKYEIAREIVFPWPAAQTVWIDDKTIATNTIRGVAFWDVEQKCLKERMLFDDWVSSITKLTSERVLVSHFSQESKVWDLKTPDKPIAEFNVPETAFIWVIQTAISPIGDHIAAGCRLGNIFLWNLEQPQTPSVLKGHTDYIQTIAFSPNGQRLVSGAQDETARIWDVAANKEISRLPMDTPCEPLAMVFSPNGERIVADLNTEIRFWCADNLTHLRSIPQPTPFARTSPLVFSPCGRYLAGATWWENDAASLAIRLWDVETCEQVADLRGHTSKLSFLSFSPNGKLLAAGCGNGTVMLWDLEECKLT